MQSSLHHQVRQRARNRCEYCLMPEAFYRTPFQIDHIIARQHGGTDALDNLALACFHCNLHKGPNVAGIDPQAGRLCRLFNPRQDRWFDHFQWAGARIEVITDVGRTTIAVLDLNNLIYIAVREGMIRDGVFPAAE
jgi:hypothetical protein